MEPSRSYCFVCLVLRKRMNGVEPFGRNEETEENDENGPLVNYIRNYFLEIIVGPEKPD